MRALVVVVALLSFGCGTEGEARSSSSSGGASGTGAVPGYEPMEGECPAMCPAGAQGEPGEPGLPGTNGSSCSVTQTTAGATVACTDGTSATIVNGEDGVDGVAQQGPVGPAGPKGDKGDPGQSIVGPIGATGAAGKDGKDGVVDPTKLYTRIAAFGVSVDPGGVVSCDDGDFAISGGCATNSVTSGTITTSTPYNLAWSNYAGGLKTEPPSGWRCLARGSGISVNAYVTCVDVTP